MEIDGLRGKDQWLPHMLGHEASGIVVAIGKSVKKIKKNDHVILTWIKCKGHEAKNTPNYNFNKTKINAGHVTTLSNYTIVSENRLVKKPRGLDIKVASLFGCALPTGSGMVIKQLKPKKNSVVAVIGLGGIGLSAVAMLTKFKLKQIIAIDIAKDKLKFAKELGADKIINLSKNYHKELLKI